MKNFCWRRGIVFVCMLSFIDLCSCGDLCYNKKHEKYNYCSGYCCGDGDQCCNVDVGGIVAVVVAVTIGVAAIVGFAVCICYVLAKKSRVKSGWRTTVIHPGHLDDSIHETTTVSFTATGYPSCNNKYQNGVFTFTLPSSFHLARAHSPLSPIMSPSMSSIHTPMSRLSSPSISSIHTPLSLPPTSPSPSPLSCATPSPVPLSPPPPYVDGSDSPPKYISD